MPYNHRILSLSWRIWISSGIDDIGYVVDDPNRPTENQAIRNLRDRAKLIQYQYHMRQYGKRKNMAPHGGRKRDSFQSL